MLREQRMPMQASYMLGTLVCRTNTSSREILIELSCGNLVVPGNITVLQMQYSCTPGITQRRIGGAAVAPEQEFSSFCIY